MRNLTDKQKIMGLLAFSAFSIAAMMFVAPIPQDPAFHLFADKRSCWGFTNFGDVFSNGGFALVGLLGLWTTLGPGWRKVFDHSLDRWPYVVFFFGVGLVSIGSGYYHSAPDNERLFWDRLPMTIAFMSLFSAFIADRIHRTLTITYLLPLFLFIGAWSLFYWDITEMEGRGDLRFYGLVQFLPMVLLPLICWLFPKRRYTCGRYLAWTLFWYGIAMVLQELDWQVFEFFGNTVSGHSLKHLSASIAVFVIWRMVVTRKPRHISPE